MSHPYRTAEPHPAGAIASRDPEALVVYLLLALVGAVRLSVAIGLDESFGAESTIALAMVVAAAWGALAARRG